MLGTSTNLLRKTPPKSATSTAMIGIRCLRRIPERSELRLSLLAHENEISFTLGQFASSDFPPFKCSQLIGVQYVMG